MNSKIVCNINRQTGSKFVRQLVQDFSNREKQDIQTERLQIANKLKEILNPPMKFWEYMKEKHNFEPGEIDESWCIEYDRWLIAFYQDKYNKIRSLILELEGKKE